LPSDGWRSGFRPFADIAADRASRQRQRLRSPGSFLAHPSASPAFRSPSIIVGFTPRATVRPGVYSTEVNIQSLNLVTASVGKVVLPLINSGAVVAREPKVAEAATLGRQIDAVKPPPLGATMDDCCRFAELLLGAPPNRRHRAYHRYQHDREPGLAVRLRGRHGEPLSGDGVSIDVEYISSRILRLH
jgi:hypothetical protein